MKLNFKILSVCIVLWFPSFLFGASIKKETRTFATKDGQELKMDIYSSDSVSMEQNPCLVFVFGGGFKEGTRDAEQYTDYFHYFANRGFRVVSIDYRLGMIGQKNPTVLNTKPLRNAISLAVSDLYSATNYLLENANELQIDTKQIIISGSSAGAMTVLQAEYEMQRDNKTTTGLPQDFRYAGVIAFAGAIFSTDNIPSYSRTPAPTLLFHGDADKLVTYKHIRFFNIGLFGSKSLANKYKQMGYPYTFYTIEDIGHDVSELPMKEFLPEIEFFIQNLVFNKKQWMTDIHFKDKYRQSEAKYNPQNFYE